ncbi:uncharacterized protein LOC121729695 [Aricia agestis]|uniref:uncharacterized protein LOC121729695 n=1 Tax=Aricia agestis TaxID=91739 RepID=UPI001C206D12|nr:uncharacterized protein LOC121729695 [Aricia agestis]XP_041974227.1 uncharacterized protein LOC121729695 [Aricia agestis]
MISQEYESLDEEVKELLQHYKLKMTTAYEPCNEKNFKECLIGLHEEMNLLNVNYIFNPYTDVKEDTLQPEALTNLINATWTLLQHHKNATEKLKSVKEQNHILDHSNRQFTGIVKSMKDKLNSEKNEARACVATAQRISDQSNNVYQKYMETKTKLNQLTKQKETNEKSLQNKIARLKLENDKLQDKLRNKSGNFTSCADVCEFTLSQLKDRERKHKAMIVKLQTSNQELLRELLNLKESLILTGIDDLNLNH